MLDDFDWVEIFDIISSQYGWSIETIVQLNFRQIFALLEQISLRKHNEVLLQTKILAGVMGGKVKTPFKEKRKAVNKPAANERQQLDAEAILKRRINGRNHS